MAETRAGKPKRLEIKKYPNRRYYDTTHSRHLTLEEIRSLVQEGFDLRVTDAKTSTDITAQVLTQIILELETPKLSSFPVPLLVRLIRVNDQLVKDFIETYFNQAFQSFQDYQKQFEEQLRQAHGLPVDYPGVVSWTQNMMTPFASILRGKSVETAPEPKASSPPSAETMALLQLIKDLQEQVAELKKPRPSKRTKRRRSKP
jgi:polyhydroxyalkanoate synthesis repressor PhaR